MIASNTDKMICGCGTKYVYIPRAGFIGAVRCPKCGDVTQIR